MVELFFEETSILDLDPEFFVLWLNKLCESHDKQLGEVALIFCSDNYLLEINREHLDHDYFTDIITFNYNEESTISGDLFISVERVKDNAEFHNVDFNIELYRVVAHGVLHLIGFNDKTAEEKAEMKAEENKALELIVSRET